MSNETINDFDLEELEDFEANGEIVYLVCALGYNENDESTGCEVYLEEFELPDEAITFAKTVDLATILQYAAEQKAVNLSAISDTAYFSLEVETVVAYEDCSENIDTIWETQINIG
jgi:hypothetical protein